MKTIKFFLIIKILMFVLIFCAQGLKGQLNYDSIVFSKKPKLLEGVIPTYYTPICEKRAKETQILLQKVVSEYSMNDSSFFKLKMAVLDSIDMIGLNIPYGLFYCEGFNWLLIPGDLTFEKCARIYGFGSFQEKMIKEFESFTNDPENLIMNTFYNRIPVHELGHYYVEYIRRAATPDQFLNELTANSFVDDYFYKKDTNCLNAINAYAKIFSKEMIPTFHTIHDFDSLYLDMGIQNYVWYQAIILLISQDIYKGNKSNFLNDYAKYFPKSIYSLKLTQEEIIRMLDIITSGKITKWNNILDRYPQGFY